MSGGGGVALSLRFATLTALIALFAAFALDGPTASAQTPVTLVNVGGGCDHINECPRAPSGTATPGPAEGEITIEWTAVGLGADRWRVGWRESGTLNFQSQFIDNVNARSFTITGLDSDKRYDVQVQGRATAGQGTDRMPRWGANARATNLRPPGPRILFRNDDQTDGAEVGLGMDRALFFQTGRNAEGYRLTRVRFDMTVGTPSGTQPVYSVKLYSADPDNAPDAALTTLTNPDSLQTGLNTFVVPGGYLLSPNKVYTVVISVTTDGGIGLKLKTTGTRVESSDTGWTLPSAHWHKARSATSWGADPNLALKAVIVGHLDGRPPAVQSAEVVFNTLRITFDERLDPDSVPAPGSFSVGVTPGFDDSARGVVTVSDVDVSGNTVTLTLARAVETGMTVTVSYTPPGSNPLRDDPGNEVAEFTDQAVTNTTPAPGSLETGVIYEAVPPGGTRVEHRVWRDKNAHCYLESYKRTGPSLPYLWFRSSSYGNDDEACRRAVWNAHRASNGEDPLPIDSADFPAGHPPPGLEVPQCPSGWEGSTGYGQQWCQHPDLEVALSPERAREFVRRGIRPSDATTTNAARGLNYMNFMWGAEHCGEGEVYAHLYGSEGTFVCHTEAELVSCPSGNGAGLSGRHCTPPEVDSSDERRYPETASPTTRFNSTASYSSSDPNDTSTQEYGAPGCWSSYWDDAKGGWVCN